MMNRDFRRIRERIPTGLVCRNSLSLIPYSLLLLCVSGCQPFVLTDASATDKVIATHYWNDLEQQTSMPLVCWVVAVQPDSRELYIGTNKSSTVVRLRAVRVTADGRVWVNSDFTFQTERWTIVK
jgi:hypothetical protein